MVSTLLTTDHRIKARVRRLLTCLGISLAIVSLGFFCGIAAVGDGMAIPSATLSRLALIGMPGMALAQLIWPKGSEGSASMVVAFATSLLVWLGFLYGISTLISSVWTTSGPRTG